MTDEQINAAIAEACGWRYEDGVYMWTASGIDCTCPELWDWANDLNAMHEAEKVMTKAQWQDFVEYLSNGFFSVSDAWKDVCHATARQRAEAFLRTISKWEEAQK
jgi:hypothetical protein